MRKIHQKYRVRTDCARDADINYMDILPHDKSFLNKVTTA